MVNLPIWEALQTGDTGRRHRSAQAVTDGEVIKLISSDYPKTTSSMRDPLMTTGLRSCLYGYMLYIYIELCGPLGISLRYLGDLYCTVHL